MDAIAHIDVKTPWLTKERFVAGGAAAVAVAGGVVLGILLRFHHHTPEQAAVCLAFHQPTANQRRGTDLSWTAEEGVGQGWEVLGGRGRYGSDSRKPVSRIETNNPQGMLRTQAALLNTLLITGMQMNTQLTHADDSMQTERFQCGSLGEVMLKSLSSSPIHPSHNAYKAQLSISSKKAMLTGVVHSFMGGQDRTFTRSLSDNFRTPDETTKGNPITLSVISGNIYGKEREQVTIYTLSEAMTCIRER